MKALLINGSPRPNGCTHTALTELANTLEAEGIETEIIHVGNKDIRGCIACRRCHSTAPTSASLMISSTRSPPSWPKPMPLSLVRRYTSVPRRAVPSPLWTACSSAP